MEMIATQSEKRIRQPRNLFSSSENYNRPTHHLLYFEPTDSYSIALSSSLNNITGNAATLNIHGKKIPAAIITSGTLEVCENEQRKRTRESQQSSCNDQDNDIDMNDRQDIDMSPLIDLDRAINTLPLPSRPRMTSTLRKIRSLSDHNSSSSTSSTDSSNDENNPSLDHRASSIKSSDVSTNSTVNKGKRKRGGMLCTPSKRQRKNNMNARVNGRKPVNTFPNRDVDDVDNQKNIQNQIENTLTIFRNSIVRSVRKVEKKIESHFGSSSSQNSKFLDEYRSERKEVFPTEYIENGVNLLETIAKDPVDFARKILSKFFSKEEVENCTLPPKRNHLQRDALDQKRFNKFLEVVRIKFQLDPHRMQQFYNDVLKTKLASFLYEERRREKRRMLREQERERLRIIRQGVFPFNHYGNQQNLEEADEVEDDDEEVDEDDDDANGEEEDDE